MTPQRLKLSAILVPLVAGALALLAWTQNWVMLQLGEGVALAAAGDVAAPTVPALALALLAIGAVIPLVGRLAARVVGVIEAVLGAGIVVAAAAVIADPVERGAAAVTAVTGIDGTEGVQAVVAGAVVSPWVVVAVTAGAIAVAGASIPIATAQRWPARTRRYDAQDARGRVGEDRLGDWDALSDGDDPTAR